jgi:spore maturation protein CgeB
MKVLITGASPDNINNNFIMRNYVSEGLEEVFGESNVKNIPLQFCDKILSENRFNIIIVFGSCMPDNCYYGYLNKEANSTGAKLIFWLHDDPYEQDFNYKVLSLADYIFSNDKWATQFYRHENCFHLPMAASRKSHYRPIHANWKFDLFFCGVAFQNRVQLIRDMSPILKSIECCIKGQDWPRDLYFCSNERIPNKELPDYINSSKFTLNVGRHLSLGNDRYKLDASTPGPRTFESAMAGSAQLYFVESLEIEEYYQADKEIILFDSIRDIKNIFEKFLDEPQSIVDIATNAQNRTLEQHTYKHRILTMLNIIFPAGEFGNE